ELPAVLRDPLQHRLHRSAGRDPGRRRGGHRLHRGEAEDLANAVGLGNLIGSSTINVAVTGVATAFSNYQAGVPNTTNALAGTTAVAEGPLLTALQTSIGTAQAATQSGISTTTAGINTSPVSAGGSPSTMAGALSGAASGFGQLNNLYQLSST